ncbi:MAG: prephenate dehydrogenase/arogenate dehydrogenase family protein [Gammaproteobacteria bacterium]|nr:prephenate dehydrogenase/arogenate dehydrogenase family protein [Gammaproteobacteria bacterium]
MIQRLCIIGVGLIGGSLARALKKTGAVAEVIGVSRDVSHLERAKSLGVIDNYETEISKAVKGCDMVVLAVPLGAMQSVFEQIAPVITDDMVITDVGSAKASVVKSAQHAFKSIPASLVPGHPIAGTEKSGVEASFPELYENRRVIITPLETSSPLAISKVRNMWQACGAEVVETSIEHHDEVLAATSHLPHMLAYSLVDTLAKMDAKNEIFDFAAGGFRDFTRIASSDPDMWHDICISNKDALVKMIKIFSDDLQLLAKAIECNDSVYLKETFSRAKKARDEFCEDKNINDSPE